MLSLEEALKERRILNFVARIGSYSSMTSHSGAAEKVLMTDPEDSDFRWSNQKQQWMQYPSGHSPCEVNGVVSASTCSEFGLMT